VGASRPSDGDSRWYEIFRGIIVKVDWPNYDHHKVSVEVNGLAAVLQHAKSEDLYSYSQGTSLETVVSQILSNNGFGSVPVFFPAATGKVLPNTYEPGLQKTVWNQLTAVAQSMGWVVYYRYRGTNPAEVTFFAPARTKVVPDQTVFTSDFSNLSLDEEEVRNVGYLVYVDADGVEQLIGPEEDASSLTKYGGSLAIRRPFWIKLDINSPVRDGTSALEMLQAALSDVADPDIVAIANTMPLVFGESGIDLYAIPSRDRFFDTAQTWALFSNVVGVASNTEPRSSIGIRGVPTAGVKSWRRLATQLPPNLKITTYFQPTAPASPEIADEWVDTDDFNKRYRWDGAIWVLVEVQSIAAEDGGVGGWNITANELSFGAVQIQGPAERILMGGATEPLTGVGVFLGRDSADYEFRAGDPAGDYIHWDGATLEIVGDLTATTGTIGGWTIGSTQLFASNISLQSAAERILIGAATGALTGVGIFIGRDGPDYEFRAGDPAGQYIHWDGTTLQISGEIIESANIVDSAVITSKINDAAVDTDKLANLAVTSGKIVDGAVITDKINNAAVDTAKIADDAVVFDKIAANSVGLRHLFVGSFDNLIQNPGLEMGSFDPHNVQSTGGGAFFVVTGNPTLARSGSNRIQYTASTQSSQARIDFNGPTTLMTVHPTASEGDQFYAEGWVRAAGAFACNQVQLRISFRDEAGVQQSLVQGTLVTPTITYQRFTVTGTAPAKTAHVCVIAVVANDGNNSNNIYFDDFYARRMVEGSIVVDGTITTQHLEALSIDAGLIQANAIEAQHIESQAISARHLFVGNFDNLVRNPGFEQDGGTGGLGAEWSQVNAAGGVFTRSTSISRSGAASLQYDATSQTGTSARVGNNFSASAPWDDSLAVMEGDQIYFESWIRAASAGTWNNMRVSLLFRQEDGTNTLTQNSAAFAPTTSWQRISVTATAPALTSKVLLQLRVDDDGNGGILYFDDCYARRMVEGSIVVDGTITADHLTVTTLDAVAADMGILTAGRIEVGGIEINADTERILFGAASAPLTGDGIFMGLDGSDYEFRVGDPSGDYIHWDGSTLEINAESFTGVNPVFTGSLEVWAGGGVPAHVLEITSHLILYPFGLNGQASGQWEVDVPAARTLMPFSVSYTDPDVPGTSGKVTVMEISTDISGSGLLSVFEDLDMGGNDILNAGSVPGLLEGTVVWNPGSVNINATVTTTATVTGAVVGDRVLLTIPSSLVNSGLWRHFILYGYVSAADTVTLVATNSHSISSVDPSSVTVHVLVIPV
jgi:hypothetical protein